MNGCTKLLLLVSVAIVSATGCLRQARYCETRSDCFAGEQCTNNRCIELDSAMTMDMRTPSPDASPELDARPDTLADMSMPDMKPVIEPDMRSPECTVESCDIGEHCAASGQCEPGCDEAQDCSALQKCDEENNVCYCPTEESATITICDSVCVECPEVGDGIASVGCQGSLCVATSCSDGYTSCASGCCELPGAGSLDIESARIPSSDASVTIDGSPAVLVSTDTNALELWRWELETAKWEKETVVDRFQWPTDALRSGGEYATIKVDSTGRAHVVYFDTDGASNFALNYRSRKNGLWSDAVTITTFTSTQPDVFVSMALDAQNVPHIAWRQPDQHTVYYTAFAPGSWSVSSVLTAEARHDYGKFTRIDILNGEPVVCFAASTDTSNRLWCRERSGDNWAIPVPDPDYPSETRAHAMRVIDGGVYRMHFDAFGVLPLLKLIVPNMTERALASRGSGLYMGLIGGNILRATYFSAEDKQLYYARYDADAPVGLAWSEMVVENLTATGFTAFEASSDNIIHLFYTNGDSVQYTTFAD